jgi:hypothetical protein
MLPTVHDPPELEPELEPLPDPELEPLLEPELEPDEPELDPLPEPELEVDEPELDPLPELVLEVDEPELEVLPELELEVEEPELELVLEPELPELPCSPELEPPDVDPPELEALPSFPSDPLLLSVADAQEASTEQTADRTRRTVALIANLRVRGYATASYATGRRRRRARVMDRAWQNPSRRGFFFQIKQPRLLAGCLFARHGGAISASAAFARSSMLVTSMALASSEKDSCGTRARPDSLPRGPASEYRPP